MYGDARSGYEALEVREPKVYLTSVIPSCSSVYQSLWSRIRATCENFSENSQINGRILRNKRINEEEFC